MIDNFLAEKNLEIVEKETSENISPPNMVNDEIREMITRTLAALRGG